jgi:hypothetical protein
MRIRAIADHGFPSYPSGNPPKYLHHDQVVLKHQTSFPYGTLPAFHHHWHSCVRKLVWCFLLSYRYRRLTLFPMECSLFQFSSLPLLNDAFWMIILLIYSILSFYSISGFKIPAFSILPQLIFTDFYQLLKSRRHLWYFYALPVTAQVA